VLLLHLLSAFDDRGEWQGNEVNDGKVSILGGVDLLPHFLADNLVIDILLNHTVDVLQLRWLFISQIIAGVVLFNFKGLIFLLDRLNTHAVVLLAFIVFPWFIFILIKTFLRNIRRLILDCFPFLVSFYDECGDGVLDLNFGVFDFLHDIFQAAVP